MGQEEIRAELEQKLVRLLGRAGKIESDRRRPGDPDSEERAAEQENQEVLEELSEIEREEVRELRAALARLEQGTYGTCNRCGTRIQEARLRALPYANTCIDCAD